MQYGSRHERHELATRNWSNRRPSRISRVTPWCVSAQALVHSSQRVHFSRSSTSRLWASISPWSRNDAERRLADILQVAAVGLDALAGLGDHRVADGRRTGRGSRGSRRA